MSAKRLLNLAVLILLVVVGVSAAGLAAPITGEDEAGPAIEPGAPETFAPGSPEAVIDPEATVIEFSIVPSRSDPDKMETNIVVARTGGRKICVNQSNADIISRAYRPRGDEPFDPVAVPTELLGLTTGDRGELVAFNDTRVFIRPYTPDDEFIDFDECFSAGETEACFIATDEECDEVLEEGEFVCVGDGILGSGCPILDHTNLARALRFALALNNPLETAPAAGPTVVTSTDIERAPAFEALGGPPGGPTAGGPTGGTFGGSGGGGPAASPTIVSSVAASQNIVPNVVGLPIPAAISVVTNAGIPVGTVDLRIEVASLSAPFVRSAFAQQIACPAEEPDCGGDLSSYICDSQSCPAGSVVEPDTVCNLTGVKEADTDIPEPATLPLFAVGLLLLAFIAWRRREMY